MESWQNDFLHSQMENKTQVFQPNDDILSALSSQGTLTDEEVTQMQNMQADGRTNLTAEFIRTLSLKPGGYEALQAAATQTGQTELSSLLKHGTEKHQLDISSRETEHVHCEKRPRMSCDIKSDDTKSATLVPGSKIYFYDDVNNVLGLGASSVVFEGYFGDPSTKAAVKCFKKDFYDIFKNELNICKTFFADRGSKSVNVVQLIDWVDEPDRFVLCMELGQGTLNDEMERLDSNNDIDQILDVMKNCVDGLSWLPSRNILHRDIKPENIMIFKYMDQTIAKIGDFGVSKKCCSEEESLSQGRGTKIWMAPEAIIAFENEIEFPHTEAVDVYSMGLLFYYCLCDMQHPFGQGDEIVANIKNKNILPSDLQNTKLRTANHLICWMLEHDQAIRPTINQVSNHPLFWTLEKKLIFLKDLCRASKPLWNKIDSSYNRAYKHFHEKQRFDWSRKIDSRLRDRKSTQQRNKKYDVYSLNTLVELIRDKHEHKDDWVDGLWNDVFVNHGGVEDVFNKDAYMKYFLAEIPDIVISLFCAFSKLLNKYPEAELEESYFKEYKNCYKYWKEAHVAEILRHLKLT